jgi:putative SOS response-associated peptidase YedK
VVPLRKRWISVGSLRVPNTFFEGLRLLLAMANMPGLYLNALTEVFGSMGLIGPNELVAQIHPRMPVILPEQHHAAWLGETDDGDLKALLLPYPADQMRMWEISPRVNSPKK